MSQVIVEVVKGTDQVRIKVEGMSLLVPAEDAIRLGEVILSKGVQQKLAHQDPVI